MDGRRKTRRSIPKATKRADGRWEARVVVAYNENGNPIRKSFYGATEKEANEQAMQFKVKKDSGGFAPVTKDATLGEWLDRWLETYVKPNREPKTFDYYSGFVRLHIKPTLGRIALRKLTTQQVQNLLNEKSKSGLSASTVHGMQRTLRAAMTLAWKENLIEQNVASRATPPKLRHREAVALSREEVAQLLAGSASAPLNPLFKFALATGVRIGEASGLTWDCVDIPGRVAQVNKQLQRIDGKLTLKDVKSRSSRRPVALSSSAVSALQDRQLAKIIDQKPNPLNLVFLSHQGKELDPKYVDEHLKAACSAAGVRPVSFHVLRHTAATLMVAGGVPLHTVMKQLGHSNISLTANLYGHLVKEAQQNAVDRLDEIISKGF